MWKNLKTKTYFISILYFYLLTVTAFAANADGYIVKIAKSKDFKMLNSASHKQIADGICVVRDENELNNIKSQYDIEYIEPNYEVTLFAAPDDPFVQNQDFLYLFLLVSFSFLIYAKNKYTRGGYTFIYMCEVAPSTTKKK